MELESFPKQLSPQGAPESGESPSGISLPSSGATPPPVGSHEKAFDKGYAETVKDSGKGKSGKSEKAIRDYRITVRLTRQEKNALLVKTKESRLTLSRFIHTLIFKKEIPVYHINESLEKIHKELNKIGVNLNQLIQYYAGVIPELHTPTLLPLIEQLKKIVIDIDTELKKNKK